MTSIPYATASDIARVLLNQQLADGLDLGLQLKHAHWNVKGPQFASLHELFDALAEQLEDFTDEMAERAVELGGIADGTVQGLARSSRLPPYCADSAAGRDQCAALVRALSAFASSTRAAIDGATGAGDAGTADIFTEVSRGIDKMLWKVEAHLQADR
jgi:starvation-inducible DNA-binding protein